MGDQPVFHVSRWERIDAGFGQLTFDLTGRQAELGPCIGLVTQAMMRHGEERLDRRQGRLISLNSAAAREPIEGRIGRLSIRVRRAALASKAIPSRQDILTVP